MGIFKKLPPGYLRTGRDLSLEERARLQRAVDLCHAARPAGAPDMRRVEELTQEERLALKYFRDTLKDLGLMGKGLLNSRCMRGRYKAPQPGRSQDRAGGRTSER